METKIFTKNGLKFIGDKDYGVQVKHK